MKINNIFLNKLAQLTVINQFFKNFDFNNDGKIDENDMIKYINDLTTSIDEDSEIVENIDDTTTPNDIKEMEPTSEALSTSETEDTKKIEDTQETSSIQSETTKKDFKTQEDYNKILNNKYDELWEKFGGDADKVKEYISENINSFMDIDGDGKITYVDKTILDNYYNSLPKSGSAEWKEKGNDYSFAKRQALYSVTSKTGTTCLSNNASYTLDDFENILSLSNGNVSQYVKNAFLKNLNITTVASEDNWEERFNNIQNKLGIASSSTTQLKNQINAAAEFTNNNSETKGYAGLATAFANYNTEKQKATNLQEREDANYAAHPERTKVLYGADLSNKYDWYMNKFYTQNVNLADINGDGTIDAKDLAEFKLDVDLDGDGEVSNDELTFLKSMKKVLEKQVYDTTVQKGYNNENSIDDVITYLDNFDSDSYIDKTVKSQTNYLSNVISGFSKADTSAHENYNYAVLKALGPIQLASNGYLDNSTVLFNSKSDMKTKLSNATPAEMSEYMKQLAEAASPENTYLHYVESTDLSKEELEEILLKIEGASTTAQTKLSKVKTAVEKKLAALK